MAPNDLYPLEFIPLHSPSHIVAGLVCVTNRIWYAPPETVIKGTVASLLLVEACSPYHQPPFPSLSPSALTGKANCHGKYGEAHLVRN